MALFLFKNQKNRIPEPKSDNAEVLLHLIKKGSVSAKDFWWLSGYRSRISNLLLRHNVPIRKESKTGTNKRGNQFQYIVCHLDAHHKETALAIYHKINSL